MVHGSVSSFRNEIDPPLCKTGIPQHPVHRTCPARRRYITGARSSIILTHYLIYECVLFYVENIKMFQVFNTER
jgi:hypothetical protein